MCVLVVGGFVFSVVLKFVIFCEVFFEGKVGNDWMDVCFVGVVVVCMDVDFFLEIFFDDGFEGLVFG